MNITRLEARRSALRSLRVAAAASALICSFVAAGWTQDDSVMGQGEDIKAMCGSKPTVVALADGFGGNTWRKESLAELQSEAAKCPNITKVLYADAAGDPVKANSDINSLVAQGANILIVFPDFGEASLPAMRSAREAGVVVIPYNARVGGTPGEDYSSNVYQDVAAISRGWAEWMNKNLGDSTLLYFSGPAGNSFSMSFNAALKEALKPYPKLKLLQEDYVAANWNPADAQKAAAGAVAKYGAVDVIITDFAPVALGVIRTFEQAKVKMPTLVSVTSNNELNCYWLKEKAAGKAWPYVSFDGTTTQVRNALRRGMAAYQGTANNEPLGMVPYLYADSFAGLDPKCSPDAPLDADLSGLLSESDLAAIFKQ